MLAEYSWTDRGDVPLEELLRRAGRSLEQQDPQMHPYEQPAAGEVLAKAGAGNSSEREVTLLDRYLAETYHDLRFFLKTLARNNGNGYFYFGDMQKNLFYISDNMRDKFGFSSNVVHNLIEEWGKRVYTAKGKRRYWADMHALLEEKRTVHDLRYQVRDASGCSIWIRCYGELLWNEDKSKPLFFSGRITHQDESFVVDPVSNFPMETVMIRHLDRLRAQNQSCLAIGFSLNNMTEINSIQGRTYGDRLISTISDELMDELSDQMSFYRLVGMRCVALIDSPGEESPEALVGKIREIVEKNYRYAGMTVSAPCSFAVMRFPQPGLTSLDFTENMEALIRMARHEPKQSYVDDSGINILKLQKMANMGLVLTGDVLGGMENFRAVVQPVVSTESGEIIGGETLMRWKFEGEDVSPGIFISILEKENMIQTAGRWVFEQAVCICARVLSYLPEFYLTVNVSLQQLSDEGFLDYMESTLGKYGLEGRHLVVEMTESCMDEEPEKLRRFVEGCEAMGIRIALDDFGSGYSSLRVLLRYPSSIIKLDRSLLLEMSESADKMNFISSIVYACHRFGKKVCMEGVETQAQNELVKETNCDMIQGFYYHRPMEPHQFYELLSTK